MSKLVSPPEAAIVSPRTLQGKLGVTSIVLMVVAAAAPLTVVGGTFPIGISAGNGAGFPALYVISTALLLLFAVGFVAMTPHVRQAGAFYSYVQTGLGRRFGLSTAFLAIVTYIAVQGAVVGYIGAAAAELITSYGGPAIPWWSFSIASLAIVAFLGYRNIEMSSKVLGPLLIAEILIVVAVDLVVSVTGGADGPSTAMFQPSHITSGAPGIGLIFVLAGYIGFEATAVFRDEARDPDRTIPRATYIALLLIGVFYSISAWAVVTAWGDKGAVTEATDDPAMMVANTATHELGAIGGHLVSLLLVSSLFAAILSFHNILARYFFNLGSAGELPGRLGGSHHKHESPHFASAAQSVISFVLLGLCLVFGLDPVTQIFAWLAGVATVGFIALLCVTSIAVIVFFRFGRRSPGHVAVHPWRTAIAPSLAAIGLGIALVITVANMPLLVGGSTTLGVILALVLLAAFVAGYVYAIVRPERARAFTTATTTTMTTNTTKEFQ